MEDLTIRWGYDLRRNGTCGMNCTSPDYPDPILSDARYKLRHFSRVRAGTGDPEQYCGFLSNVESR